MTGNLINLGRKLTDEIKAKISASKRAGGRTDAVSSAGR